jgi:hypothetical protein
MERLQITRTFAVLEVSPACYEEIHAKLAAAGYEDSFHKTDFRHSIDMSGIALQSEVASEVA